MAIKRILIISESHLIKTFLQPVLSKLASEVDVVFDCLIVTSISQKEKKTLLNTFNTVYSIKKTNKIINKVPFFRGFIEHIRRMQTVSSLPIYDIAHIHFHHYYFSFFAPILRKKSIKLYVTFYGSDFNQIENYRHRFNQKTVALCDGIFVTENIHLLNEIKKRYKIPIEANTDYMMPLLAPFTNFNEYLATHSINDAKDELNYTNIITIVCGYSAAPITQHAKIITALENNKSSIATAKIVFPMTYGHLAAKTRMEVKLLISEKQLKAEVLEAYLPLEKLQALRLAADIFIHIQSRDQMAASMLEHLAAGSVVITGKWLPYESLIQKGVFMIRIESPDDLSNALADVLENLENYKLKAKINREIILRMMSWENIKQNWYKYYELEAKS